MSRPKEREGEKDEGYKHGMLSALLRKMLDFMYKDILSYCLKMLSDHLNDLQFKQDQDYPHEQLLVRSNSFFHILFVSKKRIQKSSSYFFLT